MPFTAQAEDLGRLTRDARRRALSPQVGIDFSSNDGWPIASIASAAIVSL